MSKRQRVVEEPEDCEEPETSGEERASKKPRVLGVREGAIVRIALRNFMTYDDCEFTPGPGLNLILGPNGAGKSTIVAAICIGLAGDPKLLHKSPNLKEYIKQGEREGYVEIEMYRMPPKANVIVRRTLHIPKRNGEGDGQVQSTFKINGKTVTTTKVHELLRSFNIQLDNLTQFLPQDRVAQFSGMTPSQLLIATQEAVLERAVVDTFHKLVEKKKLFNTKNTNMEQQKRILEDLKKMNANLEREVEAFKQRQKHLNKVALLEIKKPIIQFSQEQAAAKQTKLELDRAKAELATANKDLEPLNADLAKCKQKMDQLQRDARNNNEKVQNKRRTIDAIGKSLQNIEITKEKRVTDLQILERMKMDKDKKKIELQQRIENTLNTLQEMQKTTNEAELVSEITELNRQIANENNKRQELEQKRLDMRSKLREDEGILNDTRKTISKLADVKEQRVIQMKKISRAKEAYEGYMWAKQNKHRLQGEVYLVCLDMNVTNEQYANYIEIHCPNYVLMSLVCTCPEDRRLLHEELRIIRKLYITIIEREVDDSASTMHRHPVDITKLKPYGAQCYLDEGFEAPEAVRLVINDNAQLHKVIVAQENAKVEKILENVSLLCTPAFYYRSNCSKYDRTRRSTRIIPMRKAKLMGKNESDEGQRQSLEAKERELVSRCNDLQRKYTELNSEDQKVNKRIEDAKSKRHALEEKRSLVNRLRYKLDQHKRELEQWDQNVEETSDQEEKLANEILKLNHQRADHICKVQPEIQALVGELFKHELAPLERARILEEEESVKTQIAQKSERTRELRDRISEQEKIVAGYRAKLHDLKAIVNRSKEEYTRKYQISNDELNTQLEALTDDMVELEQEISDEIKSADRIVDNPHVVREYENRKKEIEEKEAELQGYNSSVDQIIKELKTLEGQWRTPLDKAIQTINRTFGAFCQRVGIQGEVNLVSNEDYDKFELEIKVKFRHAESLSRLDATRQSGGERSVATVLYLLSLQQMNKCPFRVVDEINQGMDPINERKIFLQMLASSQGENASQNFLITPKLLPNLVPQDADNITVLFIYKGARNIAQSEVPGYLQF